MRDDVYVGNLVSEDEIRHSSGPWKKHGYVKKTQEKGYTRYWYPDDIANNNRKAGGKNPTEEDISNAEEAYNQAAEEYAAAKKAYDANPTPENKKKWDEASKKLDLAGTGQGYADAYRKKQGKKSDLKEELKKDAKRKGKELLSSLDPRGRANDSVGTRSMPSNTEAEDRKKKRKSLSLFNHGVRHTGSKKKESKSDEVLKLEPTGKAAENSNVTRKAGSNSSGINGPDKLQNYAGAPLTYGAQPSDYSIANRKRNGLISRPKNMVGRYASKHAMDEFKKDHPNVHELDPHSLREAELSTSIDASPVKDKKLRKQRVGRH